MLKTGAEYLESIRDGRRVYIGSEEVTDVTTHPAFRNAAQSFARLYDRKRDADNLAVMSYEEDGERYSTWFLRASASRRWQQTEGSTGGRKASQEDRMAYQGPGADGFQRPLVPRACCLPSLHT